MVTCLELWTLDATIGNLGYHGAEGYYVWRGGSHHEELSRHQVPGKYVHACVYVCVNVSLSVCLSTLLHALSEYACCSLCICLLFFHFIRSGPSLFSV